MRQPKIDIRSSAGACPEPVRAFQGRATAAHLTDDGVVGRVARAEGHLGRELVHLLIVMRGRPSGALILWPPRLRTLRDVLTFHRDDRWYNLRPGALSLFLDDSVRTVSSAVRGALPT